MDIAPPLTASLGANQEQPQITQKHWGCSEHFRKDWVSLDGDFILQARFTASSQSNAPSPAWGWQIRTAGAQATLLAELRLTADGRCLFVTGENVNSPLEMLTLPVGGQAILRLQKHGATIHALAAPMGEPFKPRAIHNIEPQCKLEVRLFSSAGPSLTPSFCPVFDVRVSRLPKAGYVPYQDYIGSRLEILDVNTGTLEHIHGSATPFEAPNWMPDGRTLIYNISGQGPDKGLLRRFDLLSRTESPLDTAFATRNNNDHVLSFDGTQLAISHHASEDDGKSVIYTLPSSGGLPTRITPLAPSYLHGWSPDAQWLVYTGGRKQSGSDELLYDICKIPASGGEEIRLTKGQGLSDGPEYTPSGDWIYYNSTRSGLMQIWRMRPDGSQQEQVSDDAFNNWFPHFSPDGKWLIFLSFNQDVRPDDHPYYKEVYLRLMPAAGGPAKVVAYLYGGQGTINVPSWSPDSSRVAFVSNTDTLPT